MQIIGVVFHCCYVNNYNIYGKIDLESVEEKKVHHEEAEYTDLEDENIYDVHKLYYYYWDTYMTQYHQCDWQALAGSRTKLDVQSLTNIKICWAPNKDHRTNHLPYMYQVMCRLYNSHMNLVRHSFRENFVNIYTK